MTKFVKILDLIKMFLKTTNVGTHVNAKNSATIDYKHWNTKTKDLNTMTKN